MPSERSLNTSGADLIAAERQRQIDAEGYSHEHDDEHGHGQIAWAAACYAAPGPIYRQSWTHRRPNAPDRSGRSVMEPSSPWATQVTFREPWPWDYRAFKPSDDESGIPDRIRELTKAGALLAAEIDRLQRADHAE
jgi:hypothetical protein